MTAKLNWGVLTTGVIARKFVTDLRQSRTGRFTAVGARQLPEAEKFAREFGGARAHGGYEALLADPEVQAVYLGTPHPLHEKWAVKAAEAGKHILCEKPLALDLAGALRIIAAARQHGVLLMEAFMYRCHPQTLKLVELVRSGAIGEVRLIRASFNVICGFDPEHRMFKRALGGGAILDLGCYPVSFARLIAGAALDRPFANPEEFHATGRVNPVTHTDEYAAAVARFPGDIMAELSCGSTVVHDVSARIHGTKGWLEVPEPFTTGLLGKEESIYLHRSGSAQPERIAIASPGMGLYAYEADAVAAALAHGAREVPQMTWADTVGNMTTLDAWVAAAGVSYEGV